MISIIKNIIVDRFREIADIEVYPNHIHDCANIYVRFGFIDW